MRQLGIGLGGLVRLLRLALRLTVVVDGRLEVKVRLVAVVQRGIDIVLVVGG